MFNLLIVEDDKNSRKLMEAVLKREGYHVYTAENGKIALTVLDSQQIDLIILDIMMPEMNGYEFAEQLRSVNNNMPIMMVTAKQLPIDKKRGFLAGTDDYMTKPVDTEELLLRLKALLRRAQIINQHMLTVGTMTLDYTSFSVTSKGEAITLPQKEFQLLYLLLSYPNRIFTRLELMDEIWGMDSESGDTTVNVHINRLRNRFSQCPEFDLIAVRGLGYKAVINL